MNEKPPKKKRKHVGPDKKIVSLYVDQKLHKRMVKRARQLDMTLAKYLQALSRRDLGEGGDFSITPSV